MITITGLGPGDLDRVPGPVLTILLDPSLSVVARTEHHPAAQQLASKREVIFCDDLYDSTDSFDEVYTAIAERVIQKSHSGHVVYVVPGSPMVGEFAVRKIVELSPETELIPAESFVDAILAEVGYDPLDRGLQILNGHDLPDPLILDKPTIVAHLDRPEILADVAASIGRVLADGATVTVLANVGSPDATVADVDIDEVDSSLAGYRTSLFIDAEPGGLIGAVRTMRTLRTECPWDREQTHKTLVKNLVEETYELVDALQQLDEGTEDWVGYAEVEDELGDVLLQVLFHETIARGPGFFDIDSVAETMRRKLVRRHPHVFGDVSAGTPEEVKANWDRIKAEERQDEPESALDGVPSGMPGLHRSAKIQNRAAKVGFDWETAGQVLPKVQEELDELTVEMAEDGDVEAELGDLVFSVVNLARHLGVDVELALRGATGRFETRFRKMEQGGPLADLGLDELNRRWEQAKG
ncbi:MAG: nucleoside triphosphate pyrophosphohydrolase [Actinomycetota bacterium]|nr:nucleoside triphosphate pyrophosphohydrolase [Actinomycetota bacterium]